MLHETREMEGAPPCSTAPFALPRPALILFLALIGLGLLRPEGALCKRDHLVYFPNTAYELNIYKIHGKNPGKTLMLIGGIQGNEPGGFLSADLYADMSLERGNLIVVPRANFYSIILNQRGANGDMNRKFTHEDASHSMEDKIVTILKKLISESDYLLNLHDGAGYYYPKYIDKWRNPDRFGQAIIADTSEFRIPGGGAIQLSEMAERVISEVNPYIRNDLYKFHFMDTRTSDRNSPHKEQRRSATYYALTKHHIPAFGVETSKFLPTIDLKVQYHNLVINSFMKRFGIVPESPGLVLDSPVLKYLVLSVNAQTPIVVKENETLDLRAGDSINVTHIESNYERGLSLDILGYGDLNDYRKDFEIFRDTTLIVRKDNHKFAEIPIRVSTARSPAAPVKSPSPPPPVKPREPDTVDYFVVENRGRRLLLADGETLNLVKGETLKIVGVLPPTPPSSGVKVNFKGFVGDKTNNTGEDRGYEIDTAADLMERYSLQNRGEQYQIIASEGDRVYGRLLLHLSAPRMDYLVLRLNGDGHLLLRPDERIRLSPEDRICLEEVQTNLPGGEDLHLSINGTRVKRNESRKLKELCTAPHGAPQPADIMTGALVLGRIYITMK